MMQSPFRNCVKNTCAVSQWLPAVSDLGNLVNSMHQTSRGGCLCDCGMKKLQLTCHNHPDYCVQLRNQLLQETYIQYINPDLTPAAAKLAFQEREKKRQRKLLASNLVAITVSLVRPTVTLLINRRPPITLLIRSLVGLITKV